MGDGTCERRNALTTNTEQTQAADTTTPSNVGPPTTSTSVSRRTHTNAQIHKHTRWRSVGSCLRRTTQALCRQGCQEAPTPGYKGGGVEFKPTVTSRHPFTHPSSSHMQRQATYALPPLCKLLDDAISVGPHKSKRLYHLLCFVPPSPQHVGSRFVCGAIVARDGGLREVGDPTRNGQFVSDVLAKPHSQRHHKKHVGLQYVLVKGQQPKTTGNRQQAAGNRQQATGTRL